MRSKLLFDAFVIIICLWSTANLYWRGSLWFALGILSILTIVASNIYVWQIKRLIRKSEQEFESMYLNELGRRGQENGSRVKE